MGYQREDQLARLEPLGARWRLGRELDRRKLGHVVAERARHPVGHDRSVILSIQPPILAGDSRALGART